MEVIYDTGALLCVERGNRQFLLYHRGLMAKDITPCVPAPVLAQAWRGGPQAQLSRLLKSCQLEPMHETTAKAAGRACALAGTSDIVDATVVVTAAERDATIVTSDDGDLKRIADAVGVAVHIRHV